MLLQSSKNGFAFIPMQVRYLTYFERQPKKYVQRLTFCIGRISMYMSDKSTTVTVKQERLNKYHAERHALVTIVSKI